MDPHNDEGNVNKSNQQQQKKLSNNLLIWGNERTMNLNPLILTNIQNSHYFKVNLVELKTYHEVIDEIYYKVAHLEPWEKGSRKTAGQTGMCGGVRGVGAGGIVSTAYCLLYKLFTLKLTRKQLKGLITHCDSPYIRGLGFMYVRYTQPPQYLMDWFEPYLNDVEEIDVKAGGGHTMTIGEMLRQWLVKLEWFSTLFPRIPVPIQNKIDEQLRSKVYVNSAASERNNGDRFENTRNWDRDGDRVKNRDRETDEDRTSDRIRDRNRERKRDKDRTRDYRHRDRHRSRSRSRSRTRSRSRSRNRSKSQSSSDRYRDKYRYRDKNQESRRSRNRDRDRDY